MSIDCLFFSGPCSKYNCPNPCSTRRIITRRVRMPMTLFTAQRSAFSISTQGKDTFSGPSDRAVRSVNPITGSVGVDKKHNSYARYLGRLKGPVLRKNMLFGNDVSGGCGVQCCCVCDQLITDSVTPSYNVGDTATGGVSGATGVIIIIEGGPPYSITIRLDDCDEPFTAADSGNITFGGATPTTTTVTTTMTQCPPGKGGVTGRDPPDYPYPY